MRVWYAELDARYECEVTRVSPYVGRLTVTDEYGDCVVDHEVELSHDAIFGPDYGDVEHWRQLILAEIEK